jgi:hypothetical protein
MHKYDNANRDTGVVAYDLGTEDITIQFRDGTIYLYSYTSAGRAAIDQMKILAKKGAGLTTYINQHVKNKYEAKLN